MRVAAVVQWVNPTIVSWVTAEAKIRSPNQCSGLRIWHCHSWGVGRSCGSDSVPSPGNFHMLRVQAKKKKRKMKLWRTRDDFPTITSRELSQSTVKSSIIFYKSYIYKLYYYKCLIFILIFTRIHIKTFFFFNGCTPSIWNWIWWCLPFRQPQLHQQRTLNPLCQGRGQTCASTATQAVAVRFLTHCGTTGTPLLKHFWQEDFFFFFGLPQL